MKYLLDTSVIIGILKNQTEAIKFVTKNTDFSSSYFCLAELEEGIANTKHPDSARKSLKKFCNSLTKTYGLNQKIATKFGDIRAQLRKRGTLIEDIDIFIAATALIYNLSVVTFNTKHFSRIPELEIINPSHIDEL